MRRLRRNNEQKEVFSSDQQTKEMDYDTRLPCRHMFRRKSLLALIVVSLVLLLALKRESDSTDDAADALAAAMENRHAAAAAAVSALHEKRMPLVIGAGQGTTGTRSMFEAMCLLGIPSVHYYRVCVRKGAKYKIPTSLKRGVEAHFKVIKVWDELVDCSYNARHDKDKVCTDDTRTVLYNKLRNLVSEVVKSGIASVHDAPYAKMVPLLLKTAKAEIGQDAVVLLSYRNPQDWASRRVESHPVYAEVICKDEAIAFDLEACFESEKNPANMFLSYDELQDNSEREAHVEFLEKAMDEYQTNIRRLPQTAYGIELFAAELETTALSKSIWHLVQDRFPPQTILALGGHIKANRLKTEYPQPNHSPKKKAVAEYDKGDSFKMKANIKKAGTTSKKKAPAATGIADSYSKTKATGTDDGETDSTRLVVCTRVRNEAPYLREWIEYHLSIGFDSFLILNDGSTDDTQCILDAYAKEGIVVRIPDDMGIDPVEEDDMPNVFDECVKYLHKTATSPTWMSTHDTDEFIWFNKTSKVTTLQDAIHTLAQSNKVASIAIPRLLFGSHQKKEHSSTPVIDRFTHRFNADSCPKLDGTTAKKMTSKKRPKHGRRLFDAYNPQSYCETHRQSSYDFSKSISLVSAMAETCYSVPKGSRKKKLARCQGTHRHTLGDPDKPSTTFPVKSNAEGTFRGRPVPKVDSRYLNDENDVGPTIAIAHYMTKSRTEFYDRVCVSQFVSKYRKCPTCTPETYFDLSETYANNFKDDRMVRDFSKELAKRMERSATIVDHCTETPKEHSKEFYEECLKPESDVYSDQY